jgi:hypothetical protein
MTRSWKIIGLLIGVVVAAVVLVLVLTPAKKDATPPPAGPKIVDNATRLNQLWPARGNATGDQALIDDAKKQVTSRGPLHLLWADTSDGNAKVMFAEATGTPDQYGLIKAERFDSNWSASGLGSTSSSATTR